MKSWCETAERSMDAEERVIARAKAEDSTAFDELLSLHDQALRQFVRQRVDAAADVDDLVQEIELRAWRQVVRFNGGSNFQTWLFSIARHRIADYRRRRDRVPGCCQTCPCRNRRMQAPGRPPP